MTYKVSEREIELLAERMHYLDGGNRNDWGSSKSTYLDLVQAVVGSLEFQAIAQSITEAAWAAAVEVYRDHESPTVVLLRGTSEASRA